MSDERSDVERKTQSNMENSTMTHGQVQNTASDTPNNRLSSPMLKLDVDGLEECYLSGYHWSTCVPFAKHVSD